MTYMRGLFGVAVLLAAAGCADLAAVRTFAADTASLAQSIDALGEDTAASCLRRLALDVPIQNLSAERRKSAASACEELKVAAGHFAELNKVTSSYAAVLAQLADDKVVAFTSELDDVKSAIDKIKDGEGKAYFEGAKVEAVESLANLVLKAAADGYRQRQIKRMLEPHENFALHADVLRTFVRRGYLPTLANEAGNLDTLLDVVGRRYEKSEPLRARELTEQIGQQKVKLAERKKAAEQALDAITKMVVAHQSLRDNIENPDSKVLLRALDDYAKQARDVRKKLRAAF